MSWKWVDGLEKKIKGESYCITGSLFSYHYFFFPFPFLETVPFSPAMPFDCAATSIFHVVFEHSRLKLVTNFFYSASSSSKIFPFGPTICTHKLDIDSFISDSL